MQETRVRKIFWRMKWQPTPVSLPGETLGQRSLVGYRLWGRRRAGHDLVTKQEQQQVVNIHFEQTLSDNCF